MSFLREELKKAFATLGEKEFALLDVVVIMEEKADNWDLVEKMPELLKNAPENYHEDDGLPDWAQIGVRHDGSWSLSLWSDGDFMTSYEANTPQESLEQAFKGMHNHKWVPTYDVMGVVNHHECEDCGSTRELGEKV